ncbi:copper-binding protein [Entomohabitans teleogrylli]|uniref:copper-binding protein n=1 Tax=Entomohabitans teleogrylli TaxID=1384589 RepID=UPI00073D7B6E|nr:copper-binding protein [Entomohabitans teleogrylli]
MFSFKATAALIAAALLSSTSVLAQNAAMSAHHHGSSGQQHQHPQPAAADNVWHSEGVVKRLDANTVTIAHPPIPSLNWPAMTMTFALPAGAEQWRLQPDEHIHFSFTAHQDDWLLTQVTRKP